MKLGNLKRKVVALVFSAIVSVSLTACDPPMPPDVAAQILEQSYTCEEGSASAVFPSAMADPGFQWADSLTYTCVDPLAAMTLELLEPGAEADFQVSSYPVSASICTPAFSVPLAVEAADFVFQLAESSTLNLMPATMAAILNGQITNWNDPAIAADNPETIFPDLAITVRATADQLALDSLSSWLKNLGQDISVAAIQGSDSDVIEVLSEGEVAITSHSRAMEMALYPASIIAGVSPETGETLLAIPDNIGIASAASQLVPKKSGLSVTFELDPSLEPVAQEGLNEAAPPYQAIYPVYLTACGDDTLLKHAMALYLLRMDSQGVLAASNYNPLPEKVRYMALDVARQGLPTPTPLPVEE